jgi:hypothetical protein
LISTQSTVQLGSHSINQSVNQSNDKSKHRGSMSDHRKELEAKRKSLSQSINDQLIDHTVEIKVSDQSIDWIPRTRPRSRGFIR